MDYNDEMMTGLMAMCGGQLEKALRHFDVALSAASFEEASEHDKRAIILIQESKVIAYSRLGYLEDSKRQMEEVKELKSKLKPFNPLLDYTVKIQEAVAYMDMNEMEKAIECADSVSITSLPNDANSVGLLLMLAPIYIKAFETRGDKAKMALLKAKALLEKRPADEERYGEMAILYMELAKVAMKCDGDQAKMIEYASKCQSFFNLAEKLDFEQIKPIIGAIAEFYGFVADNATKVNRLVWNENIVEVSSEMLEANYRPVHAASQYIQSKTFLYPYYVARNEELNVKHADLCLDW
jgi:tetratricopeptide (TPR) repeat protein